MNVALFIFLGIVAGFLSGLIGIGGGIILIPALIYIFGFTQYQAQGTTLAVMVPPIGILAAWVYYKGGYVNTKVALLICLGFLIGGYFGANAASALSNDHLKKIFGISLFIISINMIFFK